MVQTRAHSATEEQDFSDVDRAGVLSALARQLPAGALLSAVEDLKPYECDGLSAYRELPLAVTLPENEEQVVAVLRTCHEFGVPVVARGAGTGLSGGALPHRDGVVLSLARMKKILHLDPAARIAVVQSGVRNAVISEAAAPFGLYYAPDPSSQIACSIGGNIAENSGGVHCLKYGLTVHNVLRVRAISISGEILEFGNHALDAPGFDLLALMIGSEGMLAVVTEVTLKLTPKPLLAQVIMASFDDVARAGDSVAAIIAAGIIPAGLEMMDKAATAAVEPFVNAGYDLNAEAILLCESDGTPEEVAEEIAAMRNVLEKTGATVDENSQQTRPRACLEIHEFVAQSRNRLLYQFCQLHATRCVSLTTPPQIKNGRNAHPLVSSRRAMMPARRKTGKCQTNRIVIT